MPVVSVRRRAWAAPSRCGILVQVAGCCGDRRYPPFVVFNGLPVVAAWWPNRRASMLGQVECAGGQP